LSEIGLDLVKWVLNYLIANSGANRYN